MELQLYLDILKRRALIIVIVVAVALSVVTAAGILTQPVYIARTTVRVLLDVGVVDFRLYGDYSERLLNSYTYILKSGPMLEEAINRLLPWTSSLTVNGLREQVKVEVVPDTELITIAVQNGDPSLARDLANTLTTLLIEYGQNLYVGSSKSTRQIVEEQLASMENEIEGNRQQLETLLSNGETGAKVEALARQIEFKEDSYNRLLDRYELARLNESLRANSIAIIAPATLPRVSSNRLGLTQIGLSLIVGLFGGIGLALVLENLDTRIHTPQKLERLTHLPVIGVVPRGLLSLSSPGHINGTGNNKPIEEAYRLLGINLLALKGDIPLQTILITSAVSKEGKSTVASNLAQVLAERGQTVFLVESDMRRPTIEKVFGMDNSPGLSTLLAERPPLSDTALSRVMQPVEQPSLFVIGGGPHVPNPTALLASLSMVRLLDYLGAQGQVTLLDSPPVLGMADVSVLAPKVDAVILVVNQTLSNREHVCEALKQLQAIRAHVLGLVFVKNSSKDWGYEY